MYYYYNSLMSLSGIENHYVKDFFEIMMGNFKEIKNLNDSSDKKATNCIEIKIKDLPCTSFVQFDDNLERSTTYDNNVIYLQNTDYLLSSKGQVKGYSLISNEDLFLNAKSIDSAS